MVYFDQILQTAGALQNCISEQATYTLAIQDTVGRQMAIENSVSNDFDLRSYYARINVSCSRTQRSDAG